MIYSTILKDLLKRAAPIQESYLLKKHTELFETQSGGSVLTQRVKKTKKNKTIRMAKTINTSRIVKPSKTNKTKRLLRKKHTFKKKRINYQKRR